MQFQGVGWGVGCFFRVLDGVLDAFLGCWMLYQGVGCGVGCFLKVFDAVLGCWIGCWMLFEGVGCFFRVLDGVLKAF